MRSAAVVAGLALGLMSGTASAAVVKYTYTFNATGFGASAPYQDVSGSFTASFDPDVSGSAKLYGYTLVGLPSSYPDYMGDNGVTDRYDASRNDLQFGNDCYSAVACGTFAREHTFALDIPVLSDGTVDPFGSPGFRYTDPATTTLYHANLVTVTSIVSAVPLPASAPMFGAALLSLAGLGYAAKRKKEAAAA